VSAAKAVVRGAPPGLGGDQADGIRWSYRGFDPQEAQAAARGGRRYTVAARESVIYGDTPLHPGALEFARSDLAVAGIINLFPFLPHPNLRARVSGRLADKIAASGSRSSGE